MWCQSSSHSVNYIFPRMISTTTRKGNAAKLRDISFNVCRTQNILCINKMKMKLNHSVLLIHFKAMLYRDLVIFSFA